MKNEEAIENFSFFYEGDYITREMEESKDIVLNIIKKQKAEIEKLNFYLSALEQEHNYDVKMIDEVKGEAVKLYKELETLKRDFEIVDHECIRLEQEDIRKDKIINEMAEQLVKAHAWFYSEFDNYNKEDFIEYFKKKVEEDK